MILLYGISLGLLAVVLKFIEYRFVVYDHASEIYAGIVALTFTAPGVWFGMKLKAKRAARMLADSSAQSYSADTALLQELGIVQKSYDPIEIVQKVREVIDLK